MGDEIELVSDGEGLAVVGARSAVERFLRERGLLAVAEDLGVQRLGGLVQAADVVASNFPGIAESSSRWVKLTEESAKLVRDIGFMETKVEDVSYAMIGSPGSIGKWVQLDRGAKTLLDNPAVLAGAAGVMAQMARQREIREIKAYLGQIDSKVSEVLQAQKDAEHARLVGARQSIERALKIRERQHGRTDLTTWSTVQDRVGAMDDLSSWAILRLNTVTGRLDAAPYAARARLARSMESEVRELLAVVAHCFELQDALEVMRLDRVLEESPGDVDNHRRALQDHRRERRSVILDATERLVARIDRTAGKANSRVVLHAKAAKEVTGSANAIGSAVAQLHAPLGIDSGRQQITAPRWRDAVRDGKQLGSAGKEAGTYVAGPALLAGGAAALFATPATRPFATKVATKALDAARRVVP